MKGKIEGGSSIEGTIPMWFIKKSSMIAFCGHGHASTAAGYGTQFYHILLCYSHTIIWSLQLKWRTMQLKCFKVAPIKHNICSLYLLGALYHDVNFSSHVLAKSIQIFLMSSTVLLPVWFQSASSPPLVCFCPLSVHFHYALSLLPVLFMSFPLPGPSFLFGIIEFAC